MVQKQYSRKGVFVSKLIMSGGCQSSYIPFPFCSEVVRAFVNDTCWKNAMRNESETKLTGVTTPMRRLIRKMPGTYIYTVRHCVLL